MSIKSSLASSLTIALLVLIVISAWVAVLTLTFKALLLIAASLVPASAATLPVRLAGAPQPNRRVTSTDFPGVAAAGANRAIDAIFLG